MTTIKLTTQRNGTIVWEVPEELAEAVDRLKISDHRDVLQSAFTSFITAMADIARMGEPEDAKFALGMLQMNLSLAVMQNNPSRNFILE